MQTTTTANRGCLSSDVLPPDDPETAAFLEQGISTPPGPRCSVCGHQMCPCCRTSCDQLVWFDFGGAPITDPNDPRELVDFECCCAGRCVVDLEDVQDWCSQIAELVARAELQSRPTLQQHGPFLPARVAKERDQLVTGVWAHESVMICNRIPGVTLVYTAPGGGRFEIPCDGRKHDTRHFPPGGEWCVLDYRAKDVPFTAAFISTP